MTVTMTISVAIGVLTFIVGWLGYVLGRNSERLHTVEEKADDICEMLFLHQEMLGLMTNQDPKRADRIRRDLERFRTKRREA